MYYLVNAGIVILLILLLWIGLTVIEGLFLFTYLLKKKKSIPDGTAIVMMTISLINIFLSSYMVIHILD